jgi:catechol 2,3-dioxygenase-like lactoylglutathione lyase family enzyme
MPWVGAAKGADVAVGPLARDAGTGLAFIRGPAGVMVELVQQRRGSL